MGLVVVGIVLLLVAGGLEWGARRARRTYDTVLATDATTCGDVTALFGAVESETGDGTLTRMVEVRAAAVAAGTAPLSGQPCAWFHSVRTERRTEWEEVEPGTGTGGGGKNFGGGAVQGNPRSRRRLVEHTEVLEDQRSSGQLLVEDASGRLAVDLDGGDVVDAPQVLDRLDPDPDHDRSRPGRIGVHHAEWIVAPGTALTVIGEARRTAGTIVVAKPEGTALVVTTRTAEEVATSAGKSAKNLRVAAAGAAALAVVLIAVGALV